MMKITSQYKLVFKDGRFRCDQDTKERILNIVPMPLLMDYEVYSSPKERKLSFVSGGRRFLTKYKF